MALTRGPLTGQWLKTAGGPSNDSPACEARSPICGKAMGPKAASLQFSAAPRTTHRGDLVRVGPEFAPPGKILVHERKAVGASPSE